MYVHVRRTTVKEGAARLPSRVGFAKTASAISLGEKEGWACPADPAPKSVTTFTTMRPQRKQLIDVTPPILPAVF